MVNNQFIINDKVRYKFSDTLCYKELRIEEINFECPNVLVESTLYA